MGSTISTNNDVKNVYGWKPDLPDVRDKKLIFRQHHLNQLKTKVDLRNDFPAIYTQGSLGSCTANAICGSFVFDQMKQNLPLFDPSRLFLYYNERDRENSTQIDSGASIRDGIKSINKTGLCEEKLWPYQIDYFKTKPSSNCYKEAKFHKCIRYKRLKNDLKQLQVCLSLGKPFVFGFGVYDSFDDPTIWNPKVDEMPIPNSRKETLLGGHAVVAVGYSNRRKAFLIRNSWGEEWGMKGYFLMPYKFITSEQCSDFWVLETVSDDEIIVDNDKLSCEKDSYVEVLKNKPKKKKKKKKKRRKESYPDDEDDSICADIEELDEVKQIKVEIPDKSSVTSKCLIREN